MEVSSIAERVGRSELQRKTEKPRVSVEDIHAHVSGHIWIRNRELEKQAKSTGCSLRRPSLIPSTQIGTYNHL